MTDFYEEEKQKMDGLNTLLGYSFYSQEKALCLDMFPELTLQIEECENRIKAKREEEEALKEGQDCPHCGKRIMKDAKFCNYCGNPIVQKKAEEEKIICSKCGAVLQADAKFCSKCGMSMQTILSERGTENIQVKKCRNCGKELETDEIFCMQCGTKNSF
jgi:ribosomal protein L40E/DNA-directed RNA polymerase subunit RPC12/RpoP